MSGRFIVHHGDALAILRTLETHSVDAIVTDPPSGIGFMNAAWDSDKGGRDAWIAWLGEVFTEARRVAKPGAHAFVWSLPRTSHWTAAGVENAGWTLRDRFSHLFGTGFPKSHSVSKAIDAEAGAEREVIGKQRLTGTARIKGGSGYTVNGAVDGPRDLRDAIPITAPATDAAKQWDGWGTAAKPSVEDWWLARAPLSESTVASNVVRWGTGALHIDACRIHTDWSERSEAWKRSGHSAKPDAEKIAAPPGNGIDCHPLGRWPAHLVLDEAAAALLDAQSGVRVTNAGGHRHGLGFRGGRCEPVPIPDYGDEGGASRFFFVAKSSTAERELGLKDFVPRTTNDGRETDIDNPYQRGVTLRRNGHPTVKSVALMRWLVRLITPPGGLVLDLFAGSGTTGIAAMCEGFRFTGIEAEEDFVRLARARIAFAETSPRAFDPDLERKTDKPLEGQQSLFGGSR